MAKALIKVDVRARAKLLAALEAQEPLRQAHGERGWSFCVNDDSRHIGYVILDWNSFPSLRKFLDSADGKRLIAAWPCEAHLETVALRDIRAETASL